MEEALVKAHRADLIGYEKKCLIRPRRGASVEKADQGPKRPVKKKKTIRNVHKKK